jgi:hypothetical protein
MGFGAAGAAVAIAGSIFAGGNAAFDGMDKLAAVLQ